VHSPCVSSPVHASDVIILDTPHGYFIEISPSSYDLSLFSSKAGSNHYGGVGAAPREALIMRVPSQPHA
jgi:hypothetical protein